MTPTRKLLLVILLFTMAGCKRQSAFKPTDIATSYQSILNPADKNGEYVRDALKDHTCAPYIRESAAVFARVLNGVEADKKAFRQAINELAATRNDRTCRIWISMMLASEAGLPEVLPSFKKIGEIEKQDRDGTLKNMESNPLRFLGVLNRTVLYFTQFDMPEADREVEQFINRFEKKYGNSEAGKIFTQDYRIKIEQVKKTRATGAVLWKY